MAMSKRMAVAEVKTCFEEMVARDWTLEWVNGSGFDFDPKLVPSVLRDGPKVRMDREKTDRDGL